MGLLNEYEAIVFSAGITEKLAEEVTQVANKEFTEDFTPATGHLPLIVTKVTDGNIWIFFIRSDFKWLTHKVNGFIRGYIVRARKEKEGNK